MFEPDVRLVAPLLLLTLAGCPRPQQDAGSQPAPPSKGGEPRAPDTPPRAGGTKAPPAAAASPELEAWAALKGRIGGWARLLPGKLKAPDGREALKPALEPGPELRRAALLARYLPLREEYNVINLEGPLRRHLGKNNLLDRTTFALDEDRTVILLVLMDPAFLSRLPWWRDADGWTTLHDALARSADQELVSASRALRAGTDHAHAGRWEPAARAWLKGLSALAQRASSQEGKAQAWKAVDLSADPESLAEALEAWWRGFVPTKPGEKQE